MISSPTKHTKFGTSGNRVETDERERGGSFEFVKVHDFMTQDFALTTDRLEIAWLRL